MRIGFSTTPNVREILASLGRTEDVVFSPCGQRLAVVGFISGSIAIFDIAIEATATGKSIFLTSGSLVAAPDLKSPHGIAFVDEETVVVANRDGDLCLFGIVSDAAAPALQPAPLLIVSANEHSLLDGPGSVRIIQLGHDRYRMYVCNNSGDSLTTHILARRNNRWFVEEDKLLLKQWLDIPDGVAISHDQRWIVISNHNSHSGLLYELAADLRPNSDPTGILRGIKFPHGVVFFNDGRHIFMADAGAPYIHLYSSSDGNWMGVHDPKASLRVLDSASFQRGRDNPQEGGPKGLDLDKASGILVTTTKTQALAFFDISNLIACSDGSQSKLLNYIADTDPLQAPVLAALDVGYELEWQRLATDARLETQRLERASQAEAKLAEFRASSAWRIAYALHRVLRYLQRKLKLSHKQEAKL